MFGEKLRTQAWDTLRGEVLARKDNRKSKATTSIVLDFRLGAALLRSAVQAKVKFECTPPWTLTPVCFLGRYGTK